MNGYEKMAEFIVQNAPTIVPEYVGEQLAEAEADIPTWLKGEERGAALRKRADARNWLTSTAKRHGYQFPGGIEPEEIVLGEEMVEALIVPGSIPPVYLIVQLQEVDWLTVVGGLRYAREVLAAANEYEKISLISEVENKIIMQTNLQV